MEVKWFFILFGVAFTSAILIGQLFIGTYLSEQDRKHFEANQEKASERFGNASLLHKFIFDNVTGLRTDWNDKLQPLLDQIENVTQERLDQRVHYNQTAEDFNRIKQVLDIKLEDHETLGVINQSLNKILEGINNTSSNTSGTVNVNLTEITDLQKEDHELLVSINKTLTGFINDIPESFPTVK